MAQKTVNHDGKVFTVENSGTKKRALKFEDPDNPTGSTMRAFNTKKRIIDDETLEYEIHFSEVDTIDSESWESKAKHGNIGVQGVIDPSWIVSGKLNLQAWKMDAINKLFISKFEIEPMNLDGTVKPEFQ